MLEYAKVILPKVIYSKKLFRKELTKCVNWLEPSEVHELHDWCNANFKEIFPDVLEEVFSSIAA